jgi:hypothetical protein
VELVREAGSCGVRLKTGGQTWEVTFNSDGALGGHIRGTGGRAIDCPLATTVQVQSGI